MQKLLLGEREINYTVRRTNSRHIHLRLKRNLELELVLPQKSRVDVQKILQKKRGWIERKYDQSVSRKKVFDGERLMYKGNYYDVQVVKSDMNAVALYDGTIVVRSNRTSDYLDVLTDWMRSETLKNLRNKLDSFVKSLGVNYRGIYIRKTKRWGYCTKKGDLTFNLQLIALPPNLAEYVVAHEVAHLSEFRHSKSFHSTLASLCPDFNERQKMIKNFELWSRDGSRTSSEIMKTRAIQKHATEGVKGPRSEPSLLSVVRKKYQAGLRGTELLSSILAEKPAANKKTIYAMISKTAKGHP